MCLAPLDEFKNELTQSFKKCSATFFSLAASRLSVYRVLNVSRPVQQIQITPFLAFTFPNLPLTLRFRWIPL